MEKFANLDSLYKHLEEKALDYRYPHQIGYLYQWVRDWEKERNNTGDCDKAQWEIDFFNFTLDNGELKPTSSQINEKGERVEYPCVKSFDDSVCRYLITRLESTSNPFLKARYSHLLWLSPKKHERYAKISIDSYLELIKIFEEKDKTVPEDHFGLELFDVLMTAYSLSCQINYKSELTKSEIKRLIKQFNLDSSSFFALRANLIDLMLKEKKRFSQKDFCGIEEICWEVSHSLSDSGNETAAIKMLEAGERVAKKFGKETCDWRRKIAELYVFLMEKAEKDQNFVSLLRCQEAIESYKKIKDTTKIEELEKKYSELKNSVKFKEFNSKIDLTNHIKDCKRIAKKISQASSGEIIKTLMLDKNLLPEYQNVAKSADEQNEQFISQQIFPPKLIDQSGHIAQHFYGDDEIKYFNILENFGWELEFKIFLIQEIFFSSILNKKLSPDILLDFFKRNSWFGKTLSKKLPNERTINYNWLSLIAPSIHEYFIQVHYFFINPHNSPNLVMCIDSLTLKIEGLLRDICRYSEVPTFYISKDKKGRKVVREKDIHALLYEEKIAELFDEDDLLFFKFLLVEKAGYNLRHKVAHSLMIYQGYNVHTMHLLMLALLKLGKYDFVKRDEDK